MFDIKEQLKKLPEAPGVYLMKDQKGEIIYVGKSKHLKNRVSSYFRAFNSHRRKVQTMVTNVAEFEYYLTDTEVEALILEANLIKKHKPKFNILLRDDKSFPYIVITMSEKFPRVMMTRERLDNGDLYFGPFTSAYYVKQTIEVIHDLYPLKKCARDLSKPGTRPCLNFHIARCLGPCNGEIFLKEYLEMIGEIRSFLSGENRAVVRKIQEAMAEAAENLEFEKAADLRDKSEAIESLKIQQTVESGKGEERDVISYAVHGDTACVMVFFVRKGKIIDRDRYTIDGVEEAAADEILGNFLLQYYQNAAHIPSEILLSDAVSDAENLEAYLGQVAGHRVKLIVPQRGDKRKLVLLVRKNALEYITKFQDKVTSDREAAEKRLKALAEVTGLSALDRIEAYDISNIYGVLAVGSMVVYEKGVQKKRDYRRFRIKTVGQMDDYASMQEMLYRRFNRGLKEKEEVSAGDKFSLFPDLILIDGGKGHVSSVKEVLTALGVDIPVLGMVKDDFHRTKDLIDGTTALGLQDNREAYRFVYEIQEEVHRFAIEYHKKLRNKEMTHSVLEEIPGIGKKRARQLIMHFKAIDKIKSATVEELVAVEGMTTPSAQAVLDFFEKGERKETHL